MVKIAILYPNNQGARFDFAYYTDVHMPRSIDLLSAHPGFHAVSVERGIGSAPGAEPAYIAMCQFTFNSIDDFMAAFLPNASELQGDMSNFTDIEPLIQFNEILIARQQVVER
ncbi:MAG: ethyl tert-butyl ether degradation protein EthD [Gammaproteobacteria bacterium 28-57-27]|nr:MAG: ethyl tert-butyl ether degradation protein EthD [Gammaproteobacteria bacterium 28-57-27]